MKYGLNLVLLASMATAGLNSALAAESIPLPFPGTVTGNISVVSSYNLRGITIGPENDNTAVQGGLDYSHNSGFYAGYWFSNLGYSYEGLDPDCTGTNCTTKSFENDFYAGFKGKFSDDVSYQIGGTVYYYYPGWESTGYETILGISFNQVTITAQTLLNNVTFGNKGDTYFLATYAPALSGGFTGKVQAAAYYYGDDDEFVGPTTTDFAFRHATLGLSHALGNSGANWGLDYIFGGYSRNETKQKNKAVLSLSYAF